MIGSGNPYLTQGQWQLGLSARILTSDKHYNLDERQFIRETLKNNVTNIQRQYELGATYATSDRLTLSMSVPFINSSWSINTRPGFFTGDAQTPGSDVIDLKGMGLGDISFVGRWWVGDTAKNFDENLAVGLGFKAPTGDNDDSVFTTDFAGRNPMRRFSDISVQPGDGGWGLIFDVLGFKRIGGTTFNVSAAYLANPRDTNDTPSVLQTLGIAPTPANSNQQVNSVPDTYIARLGAIRPVGDDGFALSLAYRVEGSPRKDLFGANNGFRRPGYATFVEPGVLYTKGDHSFAINVPIAHHRFRGLNSTPNPATGAFDRGDATFPDAIFLASYTYRFGGKGRGNPPPKPSAR